jgi:hypothetical protein
VVERAADVNVGITDVRGCDREPQHRVCSGIHVTLDDAAKVGGEILYPRDPVVLVALLSTIRSGSPSRSGVF